MLNDFKKMIEELETTNSSNDKLAILKKYPQNKELLVWALDPYRKFHVTSEAVKSYGNVTFSAGPNSIIQLLENLTSGEYTGHEALGKCYTFFDSHSEYGDVLYRILDKDLKCRCGATLVNKAFPGLIPEFKVALAKNYKDEQKKVDLESGQYYWSRKLDGVRCVCKVENGNIRFFSREGHEFLTLNKLKSEIRTIGLVDGVLDGEICIVDDTGKENFQSIMKEIKKKDHTIENPRYLVFDRLSTDEFDGKKASASFAQRQKLIHALFVNLVSNSRIQCVEQNKILNQQNLEEATRIADKEGWEGLILRKDMPYKSGRSSDLLKVKKMLDVEYKVTKTHSGLIDDGQGNKVMGLSSIEIVHKGNVVGVGSGFTFKQRIHFEKHPEDILGKMLTVQYFEETVNQQGQHSLRFPVVKVIHGEKREV